MRLLSVLIISPVITSCVARLPLPAPVVTGVSMGQNKRAEPIYITAPGDQLDVLVHSAPELSRLVTISPEGSFHMPYIGQIEAAGQSLDQLRHTIETALTSELNDPRIDIVLRASVTRPITDSDCGCTPSPSQPQD